LGYVIEERFYAIAPTGTREEIDELGLDIDSAESLAAAVPDKYADFYKQAITEIHMLHTADILNAVYHEEDAKVAEPLTLEAKGGYTKKNALWNMMMVSVSGSCSKMVSTTEILDYHRWRAVYTRLRNTFIASQLIRDDSRFQLHAGELTAYNPALGDRELSKNAQR
jgi:hypothetical protein